LCRCFRICCYSRHIQPNAPGDTCPDFRNSIVRLYVTHPGVTVDGIMTKMGLLGKL